MVHHSFNQLDEPASWMNIPGLAINIDTIEYCTYSELKEVILAYASFS